MKRWWILKIEGKNGSTQALLKKMSEKTNQYKKEEKCITKVAKKQEKRAKMDTE